MGHLYRVNNIISDIIDNRWFLALCLVSYIPVQYFYMKTGIAIFHGGAALCAIIVINHFSRIQVNNATASNKRNATSRV